MDERRHPSQETIDNTVAIAQLTVISERTTTDVDRLVKHIEKFLPVHERLANLKKIIYVFLAIAATFGTWITLEHFDVSSKLKTHIAVQEEKEKETLEKISYNKNQITYVKGRIK